MDVDALAARHRHELHVHCYRMLASYDDAEDCVQETFLRAWKHAAGFEKTAEEAAEPGGGNVRAWLYKIATNVCLDAIKAKGRQAAKLRSYAEIAWLQPYPDVLLDDGPEESAVARETIELAFLAALQALPPRQRAALIAREVLGLPAAETARMLDTSVASANSALQRARTTMREHLPSHRGDWTARDPSPAERELLDRFIDAHQRYDAEAALAIAATDIRVTMPPNPARIDGHEQLRPLLARAFGPGRDGEWRLVPTAVNRMPAAASYLARPGDSAYRGFKLDVLRVEATPAPRIAEITTFGWSHFERLGLPLVLPA
ncbi:RNA polymerase subunit sigma-70 [Nocardioides iriomotensis]|uniref:Sigma-70 family RNA polymerase sigma factor n=1 Tax=Nocardioides iriomotensis TaxID=715784 RepID=A0A4Q5J7M5_9ACTN|nr:RNA polymerase subunit sigma-70 [Nocardioides iriomotensis]RYU13858.1 sigma-70 family RNA polymerase sigma factor [Nocardioides iriomotensis]